MARKGQTKQDHPPRELLALERAKRAWDLRLSGATYQSIGDSLGVSRVAAHQAVARYHNKMVGAETKELVQHQILERNSNMRIYPYAAALKGDREAIKLVMEMDKFLASLLGLTSTTVRGEFSFIDERDLDADIAGLVKEWIVSRVDQGLTLEEAIAELGQRTGEQMDDLPDGRLIGEGDGWET